MWLLCEYKVFSRFTFRLYQFLLNVSSIYWIWVCNCINKKQTKPCDWLLDSEINSNLSFRFLVDYFMSVSSLKIFSYSIERRKIYPGKSIQASYLGYSASESPSQGCSDILLKLFCLFSFIHQDLFDYELLHSRTRNLQPQIKIKTKTCHFLLYRLHVLYTDEPNKGIELPCSRELWYTYPGAYPAGFGGLPPPPRH